MALLLIISLLLHGVTILWIFTLMKRQDLSSFSKKEIDIAKREIEDLLLSYTEEMKEENEKLLKKIANSNQGIEKPPMIEKINEQQENDTIEEVEARYENYEPPIPEPDPKYEKSSAAEVLTLSQKGLSIEQIAKKLDIGTGEVELMLRFYK